MRIVTYLFIALFTANAVAAIKIAPNDDGLQQTKLYTNVSQNTTLKQTVYANLDFPTHILRMKGKLTDMNMNCNDVFNAVSGTFTKRIEHITLYLVLVGCNEQDGQAEFFSFNARLDPANSEAIPKLQDFIADINGNLLLQQPIDIEPVTGIVVSLKTTAFENVPDNANKKEWYHLVNKLYFNNNNVIETTIIEDAQRLYLSSQPTLIKSFITKWVSDERDAEYFIDVLRKSGAYKLDLEPIYLLEKSPKAYAFFTYFFEDDCTDNSSGHCLG